jgi:hypothetical protein
VLLLPLSARRGTSTLLGDDEEHTTAVVGVDDDVEASDVGEGALNDVAAGMEGKASSTVAPWRAQYCDNVKVGSVSSPRSVDVVDVPPRARRASDKLFLRALVDDSLPGAGIFFDDDGLGVASGRATAQPLVRPRTDC